MDIKTHTIQRDKVAQYIRIAEESFELKEMANDFARGELTAKLHGYIYSMAKERGVLSTYVPPPTFFEWLFRRSRTVSTKYEIRHLVKVTDLPKSTAPIITFYERT